MPRWVDEDMTPLARLRAKAGFSREIAAKRLKVVMMTLYRYESGKTDIPLGIAENMASLYGVPFDEIRRAARETKCMKGKSPKGRISKETGSLVVQIAQEEQTSTSQTSQDTSNIPEGYIAVANSVERLSIPRDCLYVLCKRGRLPNVRQFGEDWLIPVEALQVVRSMSDAERAGG